MNNGSRKELRYSASILNPDRVYVEIDTGVKMRGNIIDLSAGGLAFEITGEGDGLRDLDRLRDYSMVIVIDSLRIVAGVQKVWGFFRDLEPGQLYLSGVSFGNVSSDDRLKLYGVIERIRDLSLTGS
ncbi:MAG TPA: hypothetical protein PK986_06870 [Spirochaetota bacterium]|nr:hypothetical protein [Spirochaetota bacterium]HQO40172.1 hypothetical protein [Spirochaetota bacterium]